MAHRSDSPRARQQNGLHRDFAEIEPVSITNTVLDAVDAVNQHAKRLATEATEAYRCGRQAQARAKSVQKQALYDGKAITLRRLAKYNPDAVGIDIHRQGHDGETQTDRTLYCFNFTRNSFHVPDHSVSDSFLDQIGFEKTVDESDQLDFATLSESAHSGIRLPQALDTLATHGISVNAQLKTLAVTEPESGRDISTIFSLDGSGTPPEEQQQDQDQDLSR